MAWVMYVFYLPVKELDGTILIDNNLMQMWHSTDVELLCNAFQNTPSAAGYSIMKMNEVLDGYCGMIFT